MGQKVINYGPWLKSLNSPETADYQLNTIFSVLEIIVLPSFSHFNPAIRYSI